jgi:predicted transcriptional regulator
MRQLRNRERDEIIRDILQAAMDTREGLPISHIMFKVNLTHGQVRAYLSELLEKGLIDTGISRNFYHTTPKGIDHLNALCSMTEMLSLNFK